MKKIGPLRRVMDRAAIKVLDTIGDVVEDHPDIAGEVKAAAFSAVIRPDVVGTLGRKVTKDQILRSVSSSGKSGALGATIDGMLGAAKALKLYRLGLIDQKTAVAHIANESGCGFLTATSGTLATTITTLAIGSTGPATLIAGMGASVGARYLWRAYFKDPLPDLDNNPIPLSEQEAEDLQELIDKIQNFKCMEDPQEEEDDSP